MRIKLFLPMLASFIMMVSFVHARSVAGRGEGVALAFSAKTST